MLTITSENLDTSIKCTPEMVSEVDWRGFTVHVVLLYDIIMTLSLLSTRFMQEDIKRRPRW